MREDLEKKLIAAAPIFLKDMYGDVMKTCMHFGIACEDGWFEPLLKAMKELEAINARSKGIITADQIKSKYADLCIYWTASPEVTEEERVAVRAIIDEATDRCWTLCEYCGKPAVETSSGWATRVCKDHQKRKDGSE